MKKIYIVIRFEPGFYEQDTDYTYLEAISTDLDELIENSYNKGVRGDLLIVNEKGFNIQLHLNLSSDIAKTYLKDVEKHDFKTYVEQYLNEKTKIKKNVL